MGFVVACILAGALLGIGAGLARYLSTLLVLFGCLVWLVPLALIVLTIVLVWKASWAVLIAAGAYYLVRWLHRHDWFRERVRRIAALTRPHES